MTEAEIHPDYIPGTEHWFKEDYSDGDNLQKHRDIVLILQPTVSPNDSLKWSSWRKSIHAAIILFTRSLTVAVGNAAASTELGILEQYPDINPNVFLNATGEFFAGMCGGALLTFPVFVPLGLAYKLSVLLSMWSCWLRLGCYEE